jgi:hypothetical protein
MCWEVGGLAAQISVCRTIARPQNDPPRGQWGKASLSIRCPIFMYGERTAVSCNCILCLGDSSRGQIELNFPGKDTQLRKPKKPQARSRIKCSPGFLSPGAAVDPCEKRSVFASSAHGACLQGRSLPVYIIDLPVYCII